MVYRFAATALLVLVLTVPVICQDEKPELASKATRAQPSATDRRHVEQAALSEFNDLIGGWRGVAQPVRGSNKGSWSESAEWVWELSKESAAIRYVVKDGQQLSSARLTWDQEHEQFELLGEFPNQVQRKYVGKKTGNKLTLESKDDESGTIHQIVLTRLNEKRTLVLYQTKTSTQKQFARVAEVGYTREGTKLAEEGLDGPECVVTGGKGTIKVEHKGKTYYVCCSGCRDAFVDDPEGVLADYEAKLKKKKQQ